MVVVLEGVEGAAGAGALPPPPLPYCLNPVCSFIVPEPPANFKSKASSS